MFDFIDCYEPEVRGVVCSECGGTLLWRGASAWCDDHGIVVPVAEEETWIWEDDEWVT